MPTRPKSEFGIQLIEKQKARFSYGVMEKQFAKYVKESFSAPDPTQKLFESLELRLDNALYRAGFAKTRLQARQMASHGHTTVNGRRVTIPSIKLREGDTVGVREGSRASKLFTELGERQKAVTPPAWLAVNAERGEAKVTGKPVYEKGQNVFDLGAVIEFYSR